MDRIEYAREKRRLAEQSESITYFMDQSKLDNPAWNSLNETHTQFAIGNKQIKFYRPEICLFGGINTSQPDLISFARTYGLSSFFVIGEEPPTSPGLIIEKELVCIQMVCLASIQTRYTENIIELSEQHKEELSALVNLVQPGYFTEGTSLMGDYFGIFKHDQLVAVTGERMKMFDFTEISAVVTHPDFTGKGLAKQLVAFTANKNFDQGIVPYLHVAETNTNAIQLYQRLGFVTRRKISFWKMRNS
jgi:GNAT superfamily N-acetyltransferase